MLSRTPEYKSAYHQKTVLVTGGAGAIGSNLARALAECGAHTVVLDDLSSSSEWNIPKFPNVFFIKGDICDDTVLKRTFSEKPDYVFHLAAFFANQNSVDHPEHDLNVNGTGTLKLLQHAQRAGVKRFVFSSSSSVYGPDAPLPLREDSVSIHLSTPYQVTKLLGEMYCSFFHRHYGFPVVTTRLFNSYGPGEIPGRYRNVIPNFIYWATQNKPLPITGTGDETRDFTFVGDVVDGLLRAGQSPEAVGETFNLAGGREIRILDLAQSINEQTGNKAGITHVPPRDWDKRRRVQTSIEKANRVLGYQPCTSFTCGLRQTLDWFQDNWNQLKIAASFPQGQRAPGDRIPTSGLQASTFH